MSFLRDGRVRSDRAALVAAVMLAAVLGGCAGYNKKTESFTTLYQAGQYAQAATAATAVVGPVKDDQGTDSTKLVKVDAADAIVFRLEQGAVLRAAGQLEDSDLALQSAGAMIQQRDDEPEVRISTEVGSSVTNETFRAYKGYTYDRLALHLYEALNQMQLGHLEDARVALRAMQQAQEDAEARFQKQIESVEQKDEGGNGRQSVDLAKTQQDPGVTMRLREAYGEEAVLIPDRAAFKQYSNPLGEYLQGLYFMTQATSANDLETAVTALKRVAGMLPEDVYVAQELAQAEQRANGAPMPATTYVFFETGQAPVRESIRIDLPIFIVNLAAYDTGVDYVGASFPRLVDRGNYEPYLNITLNGQPCRTTVLTDMDQVIHQEFNNELPIIITRTIVATVVKAAAAYALNKASEQNVYANIITRVATTAYQIGMNQADLRTWTTLPKQFQVARFPTPEERTLTLSLPSGVALPPVQLIAGKVNVVYVKSVQTGQVPTVQQFILQ